VIGFKAEGYGYDILNRQNKIMVVVVHRHSVIKGCGGVILVKDGKG